MIPHHKSICLGRKVLRTIAEKLRQCIRIPHIKLFIGFPQSCYSIRTDGINRCIMILHRLDMPVFCPACQQDQINLICIIARIDHFQDVFAGSASGSSRRFEIGSAHIDHNGPFFPSGGIREKRFRIRSVRWNIQESRRCCLLRWDNRYLLQQAAETETLIRRCG